MKDSSFRRLADRFVTRRQASAGTRSRRSRPGIETLEDRLVLSTFTVNSLADLNPPPGSMTLRQAILAANADGNHDANHPDVINFSVAGTIALNSQLPSLTGSVSIQGPGSLTVLGDGLGDRILSVAPGAAAAISGLTLDGNKQLNGGIAVGAAASLSLQNAVVQNALAVANGGAIDNEGGTVSVDLSRFLNDIAVGFGGGIANMGGALTVSRSTFDGDQTINYSGGGIYDVASATGGGGTLTVSASTFSNNVASSYGGGLELAGGAVATVVDSTFSQNFAATGGGGIALARSIAAEPPTIALTLSGSTLAGNSTVVGGAGGGGLYVAPVANATATATLRDTIVAGSLLGNAPSDVFGALDPASAFNLIGDGIGLTGISNGVHGNQVGTDAALIDPKLGPLENNGGPTFTMALLPGSPALDAGSGEATTDTDQRGVARGHVTDIGAYQATASQLVVETQSPAGLGLAQSVSVLAQDPFGQVAYDNHDTVSFASSDLAAILPGAAPLSQGSANVQVTFSTPGSQSLTVTDAAGGFSGTQSNILVEGGTTTSVLSTANPSTFGKAVTFTATVTSSPGLGTPVGTVTFLDGNTALGAVTLSGGSATFSSSTLARGSHAITVSYAANGGFAGSTSAVLTEKVNQAATTTSLTVSPLVAVLGKPVTLQAAVAIVAPGGGTPSGSVTFYDGAQALATALLSGGVATFQTSSLAAGNHHFTAVESSTANYTGSTSAAVSLLVIPTPTTPAAPSTPTSLASTFNQQLAFSSATLAVDQTSADLAGRPGQPMATAAANSFFRLLDAAPDTSSFGVTGYEMLLTMEQPTTLPSSFDYSGIGQQDMTDLARVLLQ
jgi:Big-like domain-containing protein